MAIRFREADLRNRTIMLRRWVGKDIPTLVAACQDDSIRQWLSHVIPQPYTAAHAHHFISETAPADWEAGRAAHFAVADVADEVLMGSVALMAVDEPGAGEIGAWTVPAHRRKKVASKAVLIVTAWAFDTLGLDRLELRIAAENSASRRGAELLGFRPIGIMPGYRNLADGAHDAVVFALTTAEFRTRRQHREANSAGMPTGGAD